MPRKQDASRVAEAARLYHSANLTAPEIARVMQVSERTVRRWLADSVRRTGPRGRLDVTDEKILQLRDHAVEADAEREAMGLPPRGKPMSWEEIARAVHMSKTGVRMRYYALTGRERPERAKTEGDVTAPPR